MTWTFDFDGGYAYSKGINGSYGIDMWDNWFESRIDGDSIEKYTKLEDAIKGCESFDKNYNMITKE